MKKSELRQLIKEEITSILREESELNEMAKIAGDLKSAIEKVISDNPDLEGLALKKAIKADPAVDDALGEDELYDNQLNKFIALVKGERELGQRGRKADPNKPAKEKPEGTGQRGRPRSMSPSSQSTKSTKSTSSIDGKKYYVNKDEEFTDEKDPGAEELRKLARSGGVEQEYKSELYKQEKIKLARQFAKQMRNKGVIGPDNKIIDREQYNAEWAKAKPEIDKKLQSYLDK
jgi:hypothetical protein